MNKDKDSHLSELIMDVIPKIMHNIREEMRQGRGEHLTVAQFRILAAINRGYIHNKEIGELLGVSEAASSRMIDHLVQDGLIQKTPGKTDKRQADLSLTKAGEKFYISVKNSAQKRLQSKLEVLSDQEQEAVIKGLEILKDNIVHIFKVSK